MSVSRPPRGSRAGCVSWVVTISSGHPRQVDVHPALEVVTVGVLLRCVHGGPPAVIVARDAGGVTPPARLSVARPTVPA